MKVKAETVKQLRNEKLWSQQQLADVCGLGLRTVQRMEKEGSASYESIRAIASVFETDVNSLVINETPFTGYFHRQIGYVMMIAFAASIGVMSIAVGTSVQGSLQEDFVMLYVLMGIVFSTFVIFALFSTLTIQVNNQQIQWYFSFGFWRKTLPIDEIHSCRVVRNKWWQGFGIRMLSDGWMYNVSGLKAVELKLIKWRSSAIRY